MINDWMRCTVNEAINSKAVKATPYSGGLNIWWLACLFFFESIKRNDLPALGSFSSQVHSTVASIRVYQGGRKG